MCRSGDKGKGKFLSGVGVTIGGSLGVSTDCSCFLLPKQNNFLQHVLLPNFLNRTRPIKVQKIVYIELNI